MLLMADKCHWVIILIFLRNNYFSSIIFIFYSWFSYSTVHFQEERFYLRLIIFSWKFIITAIFMTVFTVHCYLYNISHVNIINISKQNVTICVSSRKLLQHQLVLVAVRKVELWCGKNTDFGGFLLQQTSDFVIICKSYPYTIRS